MEIFPAIDVKGGQAVRLMQGDYNKVEVFADNPAEKAVEFRKKGAKNLHVVDLDGAKDGESVNFETIRNIVAQGGLFTQVGGGIRDEERIKRYLELGVNRVILGTAAIDNFDFLQEMVEKYGPQIAVGVDAKDGFVAVRGWLEVTKTDSVCFCKKLSDCGVETIIYTDISKDGMGRGTNLNIYKTLQSELNCNIIASGGITFREELSSLKQIGVHGAILGKVLYTGKLKLEEVLRV